MFYEFHYWSIERIIKEFISENNIKQDFEVKWAIGENYTRSGIMAYRPKTKTILFNPDRINTHYLLHPFFTPKEFIILTFLHELGHHLHWESEEKEELIMLVEKEREAKKKLKEVRYVFEKAAWDYGKKYVPVEMIEKFDLLNQINLERYIEKDEISELSINKQLEFYKSLNVEKEYKLTKGNLNKIIKWKKNWTVEKKKSEVVEEMINSLKGESDKLVERYYNDLIFHVIKLGEDMRVVIQSMSEFDKIVAYKLNH
ncbi:MAG: hypothetical protein ACQEV7_07900 [Bacillota bacterium]